MAQRPRGRYCSERPQEYQGPRRCANPDEKFRSCSSHYSTKRDWFNIRLYLTARQSTNASTNVPLISSISGFVAAGELTGPTTHGCSFRVTRLRKLPSLRSNFWQRNRPQGWSTHRIYQISHHATYRFPKLKIHHKGTHFTSSSESNAIS